jgi:hypothetical protein
MRKCVFGFIDIKIEAGFPRLFKPFDVFKMKSRKAGETVNPISVVRSEVIMFEKIFRPFVMTILALLLAAIAVVINLQVKEQQIIQLRQEAMTKRIASQTESYVNLISDLASDNEKVIDGYFNSAPEVLDASTIAERQLAASEAQLLLLNALSQQLENLSLMTKALYVGE